MRLAALPVIVLLALSCTPGKPAAYPDRDKVVVEHKKWCDMLAQAAGKAGEWTHQGDCEAAFPSSSAAFLGRMTTCYAAALKDYGEGAPDSGALISDCTQQILGPADPGNVTSSELYRARCARQNRCEQVSPEICDGAFERLDGMTRAMLTSMYNLRAQGQIAECFNDTDCAEDETKVHDDCYRQALDKRVWLPLSLGHDPGITPDP